MQTRKVTIIYNCAAGNHKEHASRDRIAAILQEHDLQVEILLVQPGTEIRDLAKSEVQKGCFALVAAGGDGTVNAVASAVVGSECVLGILPVGTLNHFAKALEIPLDVEQAALTIATGKLRKVDVGEVNGRIFVNNSSIGLYPSMVRGREEEQRLGRSKWVALFWATLAVLRRYPMLSIRLASREGRELIRRTPMVFVGNNHYEMRGFNIGKRTSLDSSMLSVYVAHQDRARSLIRMAVEAFLGKARRGRDFDYLSTDNLHIELRRRTVQVATDGEVTTFSTPLLYRSRQLALQVMVPATQ
jgi:diacylglycerol kinase family enzyme